MTTVNNNSSSNNNHEKELESLEQYFGLLQKAVNDGIKLNNVVNKFDIVCNIVPLFDSLNKQEVDSITLKWLNLLTSCLSQGTGGPAFSLVIGNLISKLFDRSPTGSKSSTTIVKNLITQLQSKQITSPLKISIMDVLSIIFKNSKTLAIVYIQEIITLLSKMVKSSSDTFNFKASCMRCIYSCLETVGYYRGTIHVDTFKLIKTIYPQANITIPVGSTISQLIDFKCECLNTIVPIVKYYNSSDNKLVGFDDKVIVFLGKHLDEDQLKIRNKVSEVLGSTFSSLYFKDTSTTNQMLPGSGQSSSSSSSSSSQQKDNSTSSTSTSSSLSVNQQTTSQQGQPISPIQNSQNINLNKKWSIEHCLNQLNNLLVNSIKKEVRTNITMGYSKFLKDLNLTDIEPLIEVIISTIFKVLSTPYNKFIGNLSVSSQNIIVTPQVTNEQIQFVSCISYILRTGLGEKLSELGQQKLLRHLLTLSTNGIKIQQQQQQQSNQPNQPNQLNQSSNSNLTILNFTNSIVTIDNNNLNELILYVSLKESCLLINELGEGGLNNIVEDFSSQLIGLFSDRNQSTRLWAAICIRSLATHLPKNISQFLTECLGNLNSLIGEIDKLALQPDSLKRIMNSLKGNSQGCAALIATVKTTELGVPATLLNQITKISSSLLSNPDFLNPSITLARLEAGWTIMNSLIKFMGSTFVDSILSNLFVFWKSCFNISTVHPTSERDIVIFARTRADALIPLHSLILYNGKLLNSKVVATIVNFLGNTLKIVSELPAISTSFQQSTNELTQLLEFYLIKTFLALPAQSYASHHTTLMTIVTSLILDGPQNSMFPSLLHHDDEDILLPDLNSAFYQFELNYQIPFSSQDSSIASFTTINDCFSHGMTQFLDIRVVNSAIDLFSCLFISQPDRHRTQLIDHLSTCIKDVGLTSPQRIIMIVNSLTAILFILKSMSHNNQRFGKSEIVATLQRFVQKYFGDTVPLLRRISSECLGLLCRLEGDNVTSAIIKSLTEIIRKPAKDVATSVRAGSAFVFGCIQRSVGGMMSQKYLPTTIANLHVLAQDISSPDVCHYALHSLFITIQTSGFDFESFAAPTLMLIQSLLVIENPPYYLLGRIVNSIVVALGPELESKRDVMNKCTSTCDIIEKSDDPLIRAESIYFNQKLIMFAPNAINTVTIIPNLISQLKSPSLLIRVASVTCLRQLIQKRSNFEMNISLCDTIFMMMDTERDYQLQKELKLLLFTLIDTIAPNNSTSIWLKICMGIVLSSKQSDDNLLNNSSNSTSTSTTTTTTTNKLKQEQIKQDNNNDQEEDEDELDQKVVIETSEKKIEYVHRWFTKISALECVRRVISVVKNKPEHFNMVLASKLPNKNDYLVYHLHDLISISYKAATSQIDSMRPVGILLLKDILDGFSKSIDPDYEGHLLLELYQAQIMSALRPAFAPGALPTQLSNACSVFVSFIDSAVYYDSVAIKKATALLSTQVKDLRNLNFPIYNEKTTTLVQVSILKCFAQLYLLCLKDQSLYSILSTVINPLLIYLRVHWLTFLKEYSLLTNYSSQVYPLYKPIFFSPLTYQDSIEYFKDSYPSIIKSLSYLIHTPYWLIGRNDNIDSSPSSSTTTTTTINQSTSSLKKQNLNLTNEDKEFLSETKSYDDFYLIWGLLLIPMEKYLDESIDINFNQVSILASLETLSILFQFNSGENATASNVLSSNNISFDNIKQDKFKEFCQILLRINSYNNDQVQLLIIGIINNLYLNFGKDIEKQIKIQSDQLSDSSGSIGNNNNNSNNNNNNSSSGSDNLFDLLFKILLKPIDLLKFKGCNNQNNNNNNNNNNNSNDSSSSSNYNSKEEEESNFNELKCQYFNKLIQFYSVLIKSNTIQTLEQFDKYLPIFITTIVKSLSYSNDTPLISSSIQLFNQLIKIKNQFDDQFKLKFNNILLLVFENLILILNNNKNEIKQGCLLLIPIILSNSENISIELFEKSIQFFRSVLESKENQKDKVYILQVLRNIINSGSQQQQQDTQLYQYSTLLLKSLLLELFNNLIYPSPIVNQQQQLLKNEEIELNNEVIKILILSLSYSTDFSKINLYYIVISSLILFLQPNSTSQTPLHSACLQILLNFASTQQQNFKEVVSKLPIELKQQLEQSIRQNIESAAKKEIKVAPKEQIKLTFDFSKSIKE